MSDPCALCGVEREEHGKISAWSIPAGGHGFKERGMSDHRAQAQTLTNEFPCEGFWGHQVVAIEAALKEAARGRCDDCQDCRGHRAKWEVEGWRKGVEAAASVARHEGLTGLERNIRALLPPPIEEKPEAQDGGSK